MTQQWITKYVEQLQFKGYRPIFMGRNHPKIILMLNMTLMFDLVAFEMICNAMREQNVSVASKVRHKQIRLY